MYISIILSPSLQVKDFSEDFKDGVLLIECLEKLMAPKTVGRYVKHPTNLAQKLDNIGKTLQLIKDQDIKLVNIGKESLFTSVLRNPEFIYTPYAMCS